MNMSRAFALFTVFVALVLAGSARPAFAQHQQGLDNQARIPYDPKADPFKDLEAARKKAAKEHKRIMLDVGGEWCPWCHKLDNFFLEDKEAGDLLKKNFVVVKVNWSEENKNEKFFANYPKVPSYPHLFVLEANGKLVHAQDTGELESGDHHDHTKVIKFLKLWAPKR